jgi:hypothetical protein
MKLRGKPKLYWRSQDVGDARNMEHLPQKAAASPGEWSSGLQLARLRSRAVQALGTTSPAA